MIKIKLWCRLFGHDFRIINETADGYKLTSPSQWCRNCGLTKEELKQKQDKKQ
jgi:hypothetical protein